MVTPNDIDDDAWSVDGGVRARYWQVVVAVGAGAAYSGIWLAAGQPEWHLSQLILPATWIIAGIAAFTGSSIRRAARAMPWLMAGFVVLAASRLVAIIGLAIAGDEPVDANIGSLIVFSIVLIFFGGGWCNFARLTVSSRRLSQHLLDRIPPPAASLWKPRVVTAETRDGEQIELTLMSGGYVTRPRHLDPRDVVDIAIPEDE